MAKELLHGPAYKVARDIIALFSGNRAFTPLNFSSFVKDELESKLPGVNIKAELDKTLASTNRFKMLRTRKELTFVNVLADSRGDVNKISNEIEKYVKTINGPQYAQFLSNVLDTMIMDPLLKQKEISESDSEIVRMYTQERSGINSALRRGNPSEGQYELIEKLSGFIRRNQETYGGTLYRVIKPISKEFVQKWISEKMVTDKAFSSTSMIPIHFTPMYFVEESTVVQLGSKSVEIEKAFKNNKDFVVLMRIKGGRGAQVGNASIHKKEMELLIDKNAKFDILSLDKVVISKEYNFIELTVKQR